jgi:hypothetical protein
MFAALRATSVTLAHYLEGALRADLPNLFDPAQGGTMVVSLNTPEEMTNDSVQGLSLWLYRVVRDDERLNAPPERPGPGQVRRTPLPVRLHFLATPIVRPRNPVSPQSEQLVLGRVLQAFHDRPILRGADLQREFAGTDVELAVRLEPLGLEEVTRVWEALERSYQLSVSYEVSVVYIESAREPLRVFPVTVSMPDFALVVPPPAP